MNRLLTDIQTQESLTRELIAMLEDDKIVEELIMQSGFSNISARIGAINAYRAALVRRLKGVLCDRATPVRASTAEVVLPLSAEPTASPVHPSPVETSEHQLPPHDYTHPDWQGNGVTKFWTEDSLRAAIAMRAQQVGDMPDLPAEEAIWLLREINEQRNEIEELRKLVKPVETTPRKAELEQIVFEVSTMDCFYSGSTCSPDCKCIVARSTKAIDGARSSEEPTPRQLTESDAAWGSRPLWRLE